MTKAIQISVLLLILSLAVFLFVKIKKNSINTVVLHNNNYEIIKKYRYGYFVSNDKWKFKFLHDKLIVGNFYYLIENIDLLNKCFRGLYYLKKTNEQGIYFASETKEYKSKLALYAKIYEKNFITYIVSENILDTEIVNLEYCENWVKM